MLDNFYLPVDSGKDRIHATLTSVQLRFVVIPGMNNFIFLPGNGYAPLDLNDCKPVACSPVTFIYSRK